MSGNTEQKDDSHNQGQLEEQNNDENSENNLDEVLKQLEDSVRSLEELNSRRILSEVLLNGAENDESVIDSNILLTDSSHTISSDNLIIEEKTDGQVEHSPKIIEPSVSALERGILLRGESLEHKRVKILQLPQNNIPDTPSRSEREIMGDAIAKNRAHILCECDVPSIAGAAVPIVRSSSFTLPSEDAPSEESNLTCPIGEDNVADNADQNISQNLNLENEECFKKIEVAEVDSSCQRLKKEFSEYVSSVCNEVSNLKDSSSTPELSKVENLYNLVIRLRRIANEIKNGQKADVVTNKESESKLTRNDNRIRIKLLSRKQVSNENIAKEVDSLDGFFIPSTDEPPKVEDEDEEGLDITIRFSQESLDDSQMSRNAVCVSNISTEALGRLKRCPKEFTLRLDFVQGKMFWQSGKSKTNDGKKDCQTFSPNLKVPGFVVDTKKSDIISIKPSTECMYASQIIPVVEGEAKVSSTRTLRSTDSEIFNIVSMPYLGRRTSISTKSCMTLSNMRRSSEELLRDRTYCKSMPQIQSLTNILEEPDDENNYANTRSVSFYGEKKSRNHQIRRKRPNNNVDKEDVP